METQSWGMRIVGIVIILVVILGAGYYYFFVQSTAEQENGQMMQTNTNGDEGDGMMQDDAMADSGSNMMSHDAVSCSDPSCFETEFASCNVGSNFTTNEDSGSYSYTIMGMSDSKCRIEMKIISHPFPDFNGLSQRCLLDNSVDFATASNNLDVAFQTDVNSVPCEGDLFEALKILQQSGSLGN